MSGTTVTPSEMLPCGHLGQLKYDVMENSHSGILDVLHVHSSAGDNVQISIEEDESEYTIPIYNQYRNNEMNPFKDTDEKRTKFIREKYSLKWGFKHYHNTAYL